MKRTIAAIVMAMFVLTNTGISFALRSEGAEGKGIGEAQAELRSAAAAGWEAENLNNTYKASSLSKADTYDIGNAFYIDFTDENALALTIATAKISLESNLTVAVFVKKYEDRSRLLAAGIPGINKKNILVCPYLNKFLERAATYFYINRVSEVNYYSNENITDMEGSFIAGIKYTLRKLPQITNMMQLYAALVDMDIRVLNGITEKEWKFYEAAKSFAQAV